MKRSVLALAAILLLVSIMSIPRSAQAIEPGEASYSCTIRGGDGFVACPGAGFNLSPNQYMFVRLNSTSYGYPISFRLKDPATGAILGSIASLQQGSPFIIIYRNGPTPKAVVLQADSESYLYTQTINITLKFS